MATHPVPAPPAPKSSKLPWAVAGVMTLVAVFGHGSASTKTSTATATRTVTSVATQTTMATAAVTVTAAPATVTATTTRTAPAARPATPTVTVTTTVALPAVATSDDPPANDGIGTSGAVYYKNCAAARAAGAAPLHVGDPGYRSGLDRDGDGIACER